ncbi:MAG: hypothetical protein QXH37_07000, partial [Candidatus Bathyarchaeia archaeon]
LWLLIHSCIIAQAVNWLLIFVLIIALLFFRTVWAALAWRKPLSVPPEKVESVTFWTVISLILGLLASEYLVSARFNYYLLYVFIVGLLVYFVAYLLQNTREPIY